MILKLQKIDVCDRIAMIVILFATGIRILLSALSWPPTNSDEGTMGIMAMNIAYRGERPLMFYGQDYMGTLEAYLGAGFFHLFGGPSLLALRLGVILLVTLFFICMYLLTSLLFSKPLAIVTLLMLSAGSIPVHTRQIIATGGSSQTLFFGSLAFLLAAWLSNTYKRHASLGTKLRRLVAYAVWGLSAGLGLWSDMVVLPFLAMAGLLLLLFCWRELLVWGWLVVLSCVVIGMIPLIQYDLALGLNPWNVLVNLTRGSNAVAPRTLQGILHNIISTVLVSIPTATGNPFCPVMELRFLGDNAPRSLQCTLNHASWGGGYLLLLACGLGVTLHALRYLKFHGKRFNIINMKFAHTISKSVLVPWHSKRFRTRSGEVISQRQTLVRYIARLLLLGGAVLAICVYALSSGPVDQPGFHARYLVSLLIATPALIFPLWHAASKLRPVQTFERIKVYTCRGLLVFVWLLLLFGTISAFSKVPAARAASQEREDLIHNLVRIGATRFYTEYWTCYNLIFASREQVVCAILDRNLQPTHNRAPRYFDLVKADPYAAYVLPSRSDMLPEHYHDLPAVERMVARAGPGKYQRFEFNGYVVYQPILKKEKLTK